MILSDFQYDLPNELIGQKAIEPRDSCRLMVVDRNTQNISHHTFRDLLNLLDNHFVLVLNDTKVFPARIFGTKMTGGKIEVLLLKQIAPDTYECIVRGKLDSGQKIKFNSGLEGSVIDKNTDGRLNLKFNYTGPDLYSKIDEIGQTPLPPYIHSQASEAQLRQDYQTVYADEQGSAAAPTAGLHFTENLLEKLTHQGVEIEKITLHVGLGTFKPVTEEQIVSKKLHTEQFIITPEVSARLNQAKQKGKKIIAVGTTTCRVLESQSNSSGQLIAGEGETDIFIQPGYKFKYIDGLITNFHLPGTSLLMLVTALTCVPNSPIEFQTFSDSSIGKAYQEAIKEKYQFFSFGDAMLII